MKLLGFIGSMTSYKKKDKGDLLKFAGTIEHSELQLMKDAIAEGCEKIDELAKEVKKGWWGLNKKRVVV